MPTIALLPDGELTTTQTWLQKPPQVSIVARANGIVKNEPAVGKAITSSWIPGQTEGQLSKLKLVKRQMYGRGKLDLLQARVIGAD